MLKFFGTDSGFGVNYTSAYFEPSEKEFVIIDCPDSTFQKLKKMDLSSKKEIIVLITHTHGDHIGSLGLLVQYSYFVLKIPIIIVAPSVEVFEDISLLLNRIEGCDPSWYKIHTTQCLVYKRWFLKAIKTQHSPQLENKCFGYLFFINGQNVIYTGDTASLMPFIKYLNGRSILYVDISVNYGAIHLKLGDIIDDLVKIAKQGNQIYLMHLDLADSAKEIIKDIPNIQLATVN